MAAKSTKTIKKKVKKTFQDGIVHITASYNNTLMTLCDPDGNTLAQSSAGACGFKGSRKATPFAATTAGETLAQKAEPYGIKNLKVFVKGVGTGREQAIRSLQSSGFELVAIFDVTPEAHNGCRKKKSRRV